MAKPAGSLARSSSLCRSRRSIMPSSPQAQRAQLAAHAPHPSHARPPHHPQHSQHSLPSPDPDILSVSSCPALYRNDDEEEAIYFSAEKQWYWQRINYNICRTGVWAVGVGWGGAACPVCSVAAQEVITNLVASSSTRVRALSSVWLGFLLRVTQG